MGPISIRVDNFEGLLDILVREWVTAFSISKKCQPVLESVIEVGRPRLHPLRVVATEECATTTTPESSRTTQ